MLCKPRKEKAFCWETDYKGGKYQCPLRTLLKKQTLILIAKVFSTMDSMIIAT